MTDIGLIQSSPWPPEMVGKFGGNVKLIIADLRRAESIDAARHLLQGYGLTDDELRLALEKVPSGVPQYGVGRRPRTRFNAAMWILGASYRQLAKAQKISHQSVWDGVQKIVGDREQLSTVPIPQEMIPRLWNEYYRNWHTWSMLELDKLVDRMKVLLNHE